MQQLFFWQRYLDSSYVKYDQKFRIYYVYLCLVTVLIEIGIGVQVITKLLLPLPFPLFLCCHCCFCSQGNFGAWFGIPSFGVDSSFFYASVVFLLNFFSLLSFCCRIKSFLQCSSFIEIRHLSSLVILHMLPNISLNSFSVFRMLCLQWFVMTLDNFVSASENIWRA